MRNVLLTNYKGPLKVIIHTLQGETHSFQPDLLDGGTLFDYLGHSCAVIFTNLTTKLVVETCLDYWEIIKFSPKEGILEVRQIGGEPLVVEEDNIEKLNRISELLELTKEDPTTN